MAAEPTSVEPTLPIFPFEEIGPELDLVPIAARRALDHAGLKISLEGWRSLALDDRKSLVFAGAPDVVDVDAVAAIVAKATPSASPIEREPDPDPTSLPPGIPSSSVPLPQWSQLRPLDRYALARARKSAAKKGDPALFEAAMSAILGVSVRPSGVPSVTPSVPSATPSIVPSSVSPTLPEYALTQEVVQARPTAPPAWSAPSDQDDFQPGLTSPLLAPHRVAAPVPDTPVRPRTTLLSASEERPDSTALSSHLDASGAARMVDISEKSLTMRRAVASGSVRMMPATAMRILRADAPKGEVLGAARIAGIMAAKRTPELIPLCHAIALTHVGIDIQVRVDADIAEARVTATTEAFDRTGVEMEAMVAVSVACLTIYDMLKGVDRAMTISDIQLLEKSGGRSGYFRRGDPPA